MTILLSALAALLIHEGAHYLTARALSVRVVRMGVDWRGVYLVREPGRAWQNAIISLSGPLANLATAYATLRVGSGCWLCVMSLALGIYNLLPIPGSDGLRLLKLAFRKEAHQ
jgi:Zn-dependent protease